MSRRTAYKILKHDVVECTEDVVECTLSTPMLNTPTEVSLCIMPKQINPDDFQSSSISVFQENTNTNTEGVVPDDNLDAIIGEICRSLESECVSIYPTSLQCR